MQNDFLSNLTSRAIHETETISTAGGLQPRIASRFEPTLAPLMPLMKGVNPEGAPPDERSEDTNSQGQVLSTRHPDRSRTGREPVQNIETAPGFSPGGELNRLAASPFPIRLRNEAVPDLIEHLPAGQENQATAELSQSNGRPLSFKTQPTDESGSGRGNENEAHPALAPLPSPPYSPSEQQRPFENLASFDHQQAGTERSEESGSKAASVPPAERHPDNFISERITIIRQEVLPPLNEMHLAPQDAPEWQIHQILKPGPDAPPENRPTAAVTPQKTVISRQELQPLKPGIPFYLQPSNAASEKKAQPWPSRKGPQPATIHITIGRIEVKASAPASPPKGVPSIPTTMSLEEYLRRREGGRI